MAAAVAALAALGCGSEPDVPFEDCKVDAPQYVEGEVYVMYAEGTAHERAVELGQVIGAVIVRQSTSGHPWYTYKLPPNIDVWFGVRFFNEQPDVVVASPNYNAQELDCDDDNIV